MRTLPKIEDLRCVTTYALEHLGGIDVSRFLPFFDNLPVDVYLKGDYRFRRFSNFEIHDRQLTQLPHAKFFQSKAYNSVLGDVVREYPELEDDLIHLPDFHAVILEFFEFCQRCSPSNQVGVHQIRITADSLHKGNPAPEGIHRDGVDLVGIFCVDRTNIQGGETHLYRSQKRSHPAFAKVLNPGELLIVNDHELFHFTSPIQAAAPEGGSRDVFVFTCPGIPYLPQEDKKSTPSEVL
ncbi:MAG: 2OG-Fe dioxygenase family protein [Leptolyngbyaceae cyanobacterium]